MYSIFKNERVSLLVILALALALRVTAAIIIPDQSALLSDAVEFRASANQIIHQWRMTNPFEMPLYPILIALVGAGVGQLIADVVLSVVTVWLVYLLTKEIFASRYAATFAGIAAAAYPPLIFFSVVDLSETLYITLILAGFLFWYRKAFVSAAVVAVMAILTRPVFDAFAPALVIIFASVVHRLPWQTVLRHLAVYVVIFCVLMTPWWLNNAKIYGTFVLLTAGGGTALYAGNNPLNKTGGGNVGVDYKLDKFQSIANPIDRDRALRKAAVRYIFQHPGRFLELAGLKFIRIWRPWPANEGYRKVGIIVVALLSFVPALLLALLGLFLSRTMLRRLSPILLFVLGYTAVHMIIVGTIRYRLPLEPFILIFAGVALGHFVRPKLAT